MIMKLKIYATGKTLGKICLKAIRDFFQYVVCDQRWDRGTQFFGWVDVQHKEKLQTFGLAGRPPNSLP